MITNTELSKYRQHLSELIKSIEQLAYQCAHADPLIQGTPGEVFRTCGKKNCRCAQDPSKRHGPYLVVQMYEGKKQKQISLKQEQKEVWQKVKNYQKQMKTLLTLKKHCEELTDTVRDILTKRLEELPK